MNPRFSGARPRRAILAGAVAVFAAGGILLVASDAVSVPSFGVKPATSSLDETIAARAGQLVAYADQVRGFGCDAPTSSDQIAGCREMGAKVAAMQSELTMLKARAGGRWVEGGEIVQTQGFLENLFGGMFSGRRERAAPRERYVRPRERRAPRQSQTVERGGTVRTMCVRTCDGYYWPVSFSTKRSRLAQDAKTCESSCGSPAKLYYYSNPGEGVGDMVDMRGKKYADTPTAFKHQVAFDKACRCGPEPWTKEAQAAYAARGATAVAGKVERKSDVKQASAKQQKRARKRDARRDRNYAERRRYSRRDAYALGYDDRGRW